MSKRQVVRVGGSVVQFNSTAELRAQKSIVLPHDFVESRVLMPGMKLSLSIKVGRRRKMFAGRLWANHHTCTCHTGVEFWSVEK